ncbi:MAG: hypothetical protein AB8H80_17315, partial [Planctomycetota bacterium]
MTQPVQNGMCALCGYRRPKAPCVVCGDEAVTIGRGSAVVVGRRNPVMDFLRGVDSVRRAMLAILYAREFIGILRVPVLVNLAAAGLLATLSFFWLLPAFATSFARNAASDSYSGPHLWLLAVWFSAGPALMDVLTCWVLDPIRRATEQHMLGATPTETVRTGPPLLDRLQMLLLAGIATPITMALVGVPYVGLPLAAMIGAAITAVVWMQPPMAVRG